MKINISQELKFEIMYNEDKVKRTYPGGKLIMDFTENPHLFKESLDWFRIVQCTFSKGFTKTEGYKVNIGKLWGTFPNAFNKNKNVIEFSIDSIGYSHWTDWF
jgi:hypothetical protein